MSPPLATCGRDLGAVRARDTRRLRDRHAQCRAHMLVGAALLLAIAARPADAQATVPLGADLLLRGRPEEGLLVLSSGYRNDPYVDADAVVFFGADPDGGTADVMTVSVGVREPHGYGRARLGRFMLSTGAIRPVQMDGVRVLGRAPTGTTLEVFGGMPVLPELGHHSFDWLAGGRAGQFLFGQRLAAGISYVQRRDAGERSTEELGADLTLTPLSWCSLATLAAFDLLHQGLAEARISADARSGRGGLSLFAAKKVPARMLPATSLFSVISDTPTHELGTDLTWALFPRLDVGGTAALEGLASQLGYRAALRTRLRLSETGSALSLEGTRRKLADKGWTGASIALELPVNARIRTHGSIEVVAADHPSDRGSVWPWARVGGSYLLSEAWLLAAALVGRSTPEYSRELYALVRISYNAQVLP